MDIQKSLLLHYSDEFHNGLSQYRLNIELVEKNMIETVEQKLSDLVENKRVVFKSEYKEHNQMYYLFGFVTLTKKRVCVEAKEIWDQEKINGLKVRPLGIGLVPKTK